MKYYWNNNNIDIKNKNNNTDRRGVEARRRTRDDANHGWR